MFFGTGKDHQKGSARHQQECPPYQRLSVISCLGRRTAGLRRVTGLRRVAGLGCVPVRGLAGAILVRLIRLYRRIDPFCFRQHIIAVVVGDKSDRRIFCLRFHFCYGTILSQIEHCRGLIVTRVGHSNGNSGLDFHPVALAVHKKQIQGVQVGPVFLHAGFHPRPGLFIAAGDRVHHKGQSIQCLAAHRNLYAIFQLDAGLPIYDRCFCPSCLLNRFHHHRNFFRLRCSGKCRNRKQ